MQVVDFIIISRSIITNTHTHTIVLLLFWNLSGTTRVSRYQKGKKQGGNTNLDLLEQETVSEVASAEPYANLHLIPDNHANSVYRPDALPAAQPTASKH